MKVLRFDKDDVDENVPCLGADVLVAGIADDDDDAADVSPPGRPFTRPADGAIVRDTEGAEDDDDEQEEEAAGGGAR